MPAPYSQDLRDRVVSAVSNGSSARGAAKRFGIGLGTAGGRSVCVPKGMPGPGPWAAIIAHA